MKVLRSHIHRIRDIRFDVMFSSSLPSFPHLSRYVDPPEDLHVDEYRNESKADLLSTSGIINIVIREILS